jgi:hypothetical protein
MPATASILRLPVVNSSLLFRITDDHQLSSLVRSMIGVEVTRSVFLSDMSTHFSMNLQSFPIDLEADGHFRIGSIYSTNSFLKRYRETAAGLVALQAAGKIAASHAYSWEIFQHEGDSEYFRIKETRRFSHGTVAIERTIFTDFANAWLSRDRFTVLLSKESLEIGGAIALFAEKIVPRNSLHVSHLDEGLQITQETPFTPDSVLIRLIGMMQAAG